MQERRFAEPGVEADAEGLQVRPDVGKHRLLAVVAEGIDAVVERGLQVLAAVQLDEPLGDLFDVRAVVSVLGKGNLVAQRLLIPAVHGQGQKPDLPARRH